MGAFYSRPKTPRQRDPRREEAHDNLPFAILNWHFAIPAKCKIQNANLKLLVPYRGQKNPTSRIVGRERPIAFSSGRGQTGGMSDRDKDHDGGGLAVVVLAGFLALLLIVAAGGGWLYLRHLQQQRINELVMEAELAEYNAQQAAASLAAAEAAANAAAAVLDAKAEEP